MSSCLFFLSHFLLILVFDFLSILSMFFTADSGLLVHPQYVLYYWLRTSCPFSVCSLLLTQDFLSILSMFFTADSGLLVHSQYVLYCWLRTSCLFSVCSLLLTQDFLSILSMFFTTDSGLLVHSQYVLYCWIRTSCPFLAYSLLLTQDTAFLKVYRDLAGISRQAKQEWLTPGSGMRRHFHHFLLLLLGWKEITSFPFQHHARSHGISREFYLNV